MSSHWPTVSVQGGNAHQRSDWLMAQFAQFWQGSESSRSHDFAYTWHAQDEFLSLSPLLAGLNVGINLVVVEWREALIWVLPMKNRIEAVADVPLPCVIRDTQKV